MACSILTQDRPEFPLAGLRKRRDNATREELMILFHRTSLRCCVSLVAVALAFASPAYTQEDSRKKTAGQTEKDLAVIDQWVERLQAGGTQPAEGFQTLYDLLGGEASIHALVDDFVARAAVDPKVNFTRQGTQRAWDATAENVEKLKKHLTQFLCFVTGGPQTYEGRDVHEVHRGMKITNAEFNAFKEDFRASLVALQIAPALHNELTDILEATRAAIVEE